MGKNKHVSHRKITTRNSNEDEVVIFEQNHYKEDGFKL